MFKIYKKKDYTFFNPIDWENDAVYDNSKYILQWTRRFPVWVDGIYGQIIYTAKPGIFGWIKFVYSVVKYELNEKLREKI